MAVTNRIRYAVVSVSSIFIVVMTFTAPDMFAAGNSNRLCVCGVLDAILIALIWLIFSPIDDNSIFNLYRENDIVGY